MTRHLQFRVEEEVYRACEEAAEQAGMSLNSYGAQMVAQWVGVKLEPPKHKAVPRRHQRTMEQIAAILASDDERAIRLLTLAAEVVAPPQAARKAG